MSRKSKSESNATPQYSVLLISHDRDFPLSGSGLFVREPDRDTLSGRRYPTFSFESDPLDPRAAYFFLQVDQDNGDFRRSLINAYIDLRPDVAFSLGYGIADRAVDDIQLRVPSQLLKVWPQKSPVTKLDHIGVSKLYDRDCRWDKLASHITSPLWPKDYRQRSKDNVAPEGKGCVAMVHCGETENYVGRLRSRYREVDLFDRSRVLMETYADYADHEAWVLRAPFVALDESAPSDMNEHPRRRAQDLIYSYVTSYVEHERRMPGPAIVSNKKNGVTKDDRKARLVFETQATGPTDEGKLRKIIAKEANDIWKVVRNFCVTGALSAIRAFFGSTGIEVELNNYDRAILNVLCRSGILETTVSKRRLISFESSYDISLLPTRFVSFLGDVESLQHLSSEEKRLDNFARKWGRDPLVGKAATALARNEGLRDEEDFEMCG